MQLRNKMLKLFLVIQKAGATILMQTASFVTLMLHVCLHVWMRNLWRTLSKIVFNNFSDKLAVDNFSRFCVLSDWSPEMTSGISCSELFFNLFYRLETDLVFSISNPQVVCNGFNPEIVVNQMNAARAANTFKSERIVNHVNCRKAASNPQHVCDMSNSEHVLQCLTLNLSLAV